MDLGASGRAEKSFSSTITHYLLLTAHYFPPLEEYRGLCASRNEYCHEVSFAQSNPLPPIGAATKIAGVLGHHIPLRGNGVKHGICCKAARVESRGTNAM
jgi:hypothetical protein